MPDILCTRRQAGTQQYRVQTGHKLVLRGDYTAPPHNCRRGRRQIADAGHMDKIQALELKLDSLIDQVQQLAATNRALREQQSQWQSERQRLIKNNEVARTRVETMINRLKGLGQDNK